MIAQQALIATMFGSPPAHTPRFGDAIETFIRREGAERFIEDVRRDEPKLAGYRRIEEREPRGEGWTELGFGPAARIS